MYRWLWVRLAGAVLGIALIAIAGASAADASWSAPLTLDHAVEGVVGNTRGVQAFVWTEFMPGSVGVPIGNRRYVVSYVQARLRLPDGRLARPQALTRTGGVAAGKAAIGLDARGAATAVWTEVRPGHHSVMVSVRAPGGRFGAGVEIGRMGLDHPTGALRLAVAPDGGAVIAWIRAHRIRAVQRPAGQCVGGSPRACFGPEQSIPVRCSRGASVCIETYPTSLTLALGPSGRAHAVWSEVERAGQAHRVIRLAVTGGARRFRSPRTISPLDEVSTQPTIAVTRDGRAVLAWRAQERAGLGGRIVAAVSDRDGHVRAPAQNLSPVGCFAPQLRINPRDETTAVWGCRAGGRFPSPLSDARWVSAAVRPAGGPFDPALRILDAAGVPALAFDGRANTVLAYNDDETIQTLIRRPEEAFGEPIQLARSFYEPALVAAGDRLSIVWMGDRPGTTLLSDWTP